MISPLKWIYNLQELQAERRERAKQQEAIKAQLLDRLIVLDNKKIDHTMDMDNKWVYDMFTFIEKLDNWSKLYNTKIAQALNIKR